METTVDGNELYDLFDNIIEDYDDHLDSLGTQIYEKHFVGILVNGRMNNIAKTFSLAKIPLDLFYNKSIVPYMESFWVPNGYRKYLAIFTLSQYSNNEINEIEPINKTNIIIKIQKRFRSAYNRRKAFVNNCNGTISKLLYHRELKGYFPRPVKMSLLRGLLLN